MKSYETTTLVNATEDRIWSILTAAGDYPAWNPGVDRVEGKIAPGETIKVVVKVNPGRAFPVKVTEFAPGRRMVWSGGMPFGLFKGVRTFTLTAEGQATRFNMREEYTGPLLPLIWRSIPDLSGTFEQFGAGLKAKAEARM